MTSETAVPNSITTNDLIIAMESPAWFLNDGYIYLE